MTEELKESLLFMKRPVLYMLFAVTWAICTGLVMAYGPQDWSFLRQVLGGLFAGMWSFMCIFANRILIA